MTKKKGQPIGQTIGGILVGFDQQIFRTTPPVNELVAKGDAACAAVAASGGGTVTVGMPGDPGGRPTSRGRGDDREPSSESADRLRLVRRRASRSSSTWSPAAASRSFVVDGHELLRTTGDGPHPLGLLPDGAVRRPGPRRRVHVRRATPTTCRPTLPPHAIHGTVLDRRWQAVGDATIATDLGPDWPFAGRAVQRFELSADA